MAGARKRVGLALGGGVVRGFAHVGVLNVLSRAGVHVDCVAGTSAGAIIGALYCAGFAPEVIQRTALRLQWWHVAQPVFSIRGLVTFAPLERWLVRTLGNLRFEDLQVPFASVATDIETGRPVVLREGYLARAVRASSSVPGLVTPVEIGTHLLCDGGVSDNLPVSAARGLGADFVIGVNLFDPLFARPHNFFTIGFAAVETMVRQAGGGIAAADVLISPDLIGRSYLRFSTRLDSIERGQVAAGAALPAILSALNAGGSEIVEKLESVGVPASDH